MLVVFPCVYLYFSIFPAEGQVINQDQTYLNIPWQGGEIYLDETIFHYSEGQKSDYAVYWSKDSTPSKNDPLLTSSVEKPTVKLLPGDRLGMIAGDERNKYNLYILHSDGKNDKQVYIESREKAEALLNEMVEGKEVELSE